MTYSPEFREQVIEGLAQDLNSGRHGLEGVPTAIKLVLRDDMWKERIIRRTGEIVTFGRFEAFVSALPHKGGLGSSMAIVKRICSDDPEALNLIDQAMKRPRGGDNRTQDTPTNVDNINIGRPDGTSAQHAIRRLRKDRPDLHAQVLAKGISPHAAMVEAGFRRKTATVPVDDPEKVSAFLAKHFEPAEIRKIADLAVFLREGDQP